MTIAFDVIAEPAALAEFRLKERDEKRGPRLTLPDNTLVKFRQVCVRVGYEYGKHSFTKEEWEQCAIKLVAGQSGVDEVSVQRVVEALALHSPYKMLHRAVYKILVPALAAKGAHRNIRAMWFAELPTERHGRIEERVRRWTGEYDSGYSGGYYDPEDYEPPTLYRMKSQSLYRVRDWDNGKLWLVYPDDVILTDSIV